MDKALAWWKEVQPDFKLLGRTFFSRCKEDNITISAGHLAYVSLLSLVPLIMVIFTLMSAFPAFASARSKLEDFIFNNFVPASGDIVQRYITEFVGNASQMGAIGILSLLVVALLLISNIDKTLNRIWRTPSDRPLIYTIAIYWMVITLGPVLMGSSIIATSYLITLATFTGEYTVGLGAFFLKLVPSMTAVLAFLILFMLVPNRRVLFRHAFAGAIVSTLLFELCKKGFSIYVTSFPNYELIYGALAVIPILFVWVYLSWIVVLLGAEFTCSVTEVFGRNNRDEPSEIAIAD